METRKVQTVGNGTYTVSLPKEWADAEGVTAGDTVTLHSHADGVLVIQAREGSDGRIRSTDRDDVGDGMRAGDRNDPAVRTAALDPRSLEGTIRAAYAAGVRTVELDHEEPLGAEQRRAIESVLRRRIGTSMTEASRGGTAVRMLLDPGEVSVSQSVRQLAFVVDSTQRAAVESLATTGDRATLAERADHAARLSAMIDRTVTLGMADLEAADAIGVSRSALFESWTTMRELGRVREAAAGIAEAAARMDEPLAEPQLAETREIAAEIRSIVSDGVGTVVGDDGDDSADAAREALAAADRACEEIDAFDRRLATAEERTPELRAVLSRLRRTATCGGTIAELGLRRTIRQADSATDRPVRMPEPASR